MLRRYTIHRGARPAGDALPDGVRQDARFRCKKHPLHPPEALVTAYFAAPGEASWQEFRRAYVAELERRFQEDCTPFDRLAALATEQDVYIGCSCPTKRSPRVDRCHTWLALEFMQAKYPGLRVEFPAAGIGKRENIGPLPGPLPRG